MSRDTAQAEWERQRSLTLWLNRQLARHGSDRTHAVQLAQGLDAHDWTRGLPRRSEAEQVRAEAAHVASLDDRTRRALAFAEAGGDGLGPGPSAEVIAEARAALGRAA
jgi:hypothetical protein